MTRKKNISMIPTIIILRLHEDISMIPTIIILVLHIEYNHDTNHNNTWATRRI